MMNAPTPGDASQTTRTVITVDGRDIPAKPGTSVLATCLENGIYIPHLCYMEGMTAAPASCRLCFVEIDGGTGPVTACTEIVRDGLSVRTDTKAVRELQRTGLTLLLTAHDVRCRDCPANKRCELQKMARFLKVGLKVRDLPSYLKTITLDETHPSLDHHPNRCVLCGRCVDECGKRHGTSLISIARRGLEARITFQGVTDLTCTACLSVCPVGALTLKKIGDNGPPSG